MQVRGYRWEQERGYKQELAKGYRELDCNWLLEMGCRKMQAQPPPEPVANPASLERRKGGGRPLLCSRQG